MQIGTNNFLSQKEDGFVDKEGRLFSNRGAHELHDVFMGVREHLSACPYCDSTIGVYERVKADFMYHYLIDGTFVVRNDSHAVKTTYGGCRCLSCNEELPDAFKKKVTYENT